MAAFISYLHTILLYAVSRDHPVVFSSQACCCESCYLDGIGGTVPAEPCLFEEEENFALAVQVGAACVRVCLCERLSCIGS